MGLVARAFEYTIIRVEGVNTIPCDLCMGYTEDWHLEYRIQESLSSVVCSLCAIDINKQTDTCAACIPDPTDDRVCDSCGREYRRAIPKVPVPAEETTETQQKEQVAA